jgi:hypothetical protein
MAFESVSIYCEPQSKPFVRISEKNDDELLQGDENTWKAMLKANVSIRKPYEDLPSLFIYPPFGYVWISLPHKVAVREVVFR